MVLVEQATYEQDLAESFVRAHRLYGTEPAEITKCAVQIGGFLTRWRDEGERSFSKFDPGAFLSAVDDHLKAPQA